MDVGHLISGSFAFSKTNLNIWKFMIHILLKPCLENFEHFFVSMWDAVVWTFVGIAFLWNWNENWTFPVLWPLLTFPNLLAYWAQHFHDPDDHDDEITHLEPDILECKLKWALGSITINKATGGDGIPVELFQNLKGDAVKVLHSICQQNSAVATGLENITFHSNPKERQCQKMLKLLHSCTHLTWW